MKVLFITHYIYMMGANRSMLRLMLELREQGVTPIVLLPSHRLKSASSGREGQTLVDHLDKHGISYIAAPFRMAKMGSRLLSTAAYFYNRAVYPRILKQVRPLGIDLIHSNSSATDLGAWLSRRLGVPHVWHLREYGDLDYGLRSPFGSFYDRRYFEGDHYFIAISQSILNHYKPLINPSRISLIYNGINPPENPGHHRDEQDGTVKICVVGYLTPLKRQLDVVRAIERLNSQPLSSPIHLYLAGRGEDDYIKKVEQYITSHGLESMVTLTGQIEDINGFLSGMVIGVLASESEAFGRVTVEYMMNSLAVVATDSGASRELITDRATGLLYPAGDIEALADRLRELVNDKPLRTTLAEAGREHALARFTSRANSSAVNDLYNRLLHAE